MRIKKVICFCIFLLLFCAQGFALESGIKILSKDEMSKLTDENLVSAYIDAAVEVDASKTLHNTSGFMPDDYKSFKEMLRYRILLLNEIKKRKLDIPQIN